MDPLGKIIRRHLELGAGHGNIGFLLQILSESLLLFFINNCSCSKIDLLFALEKKKTCQESLICSNVLFRKKIV